MAKKRNFLNTNITSCLTAILLLFAFFAITNANAEAEDYPPLPLNASYLMGNAVQPEVIIDTGGRRQGRFRMLDQWWWMCFVHVRPLEGKEALDTQYARNLVLHAWQGNDESNKLTGEEGVLEIGGQNVYWAEGILMNGRIKARYYVWDDSSSGRRFISDTNIYRRYLTPDSMLTTVQKEMTEYLVLSTLNKEYLDTNERNWSGKREKIGKLGFTVLHPTDSKVEFLPGATDKSKGKSSQYNSLWVLPVGSNWRYDLTWGVKSKSKIKDLIINLLPDSLVVRDNQEDPDIKVKILDLVDHNELHWSGNARVTIKTNGHKDIKEWHFHIGHWKWGKQYFTALLAAESYDKWRNLEFDGSISSNNQVDQDIMIPRWNHWIKSIEHAPESLYEQ